MYIVIVGNPCDGFNYYGPFEQFDEARTWVKGLEGEWWIKLLRDPRILKDFSL